MQCFLAMKQFVQISDLTLRARTYFVSNTYLLNNLRYKNESQNAGKQSMLRYLRTQFSIKRHLFWLFGIILTRYDIRQDTYKISVCDSIFIANGTVDCLELLESLDLVLVCYSYAQSILKLQFKLISLKTKLQNAGICIKEHAQDYLGMHCSSVGRQVL